MLFQHLICVIILKLIYLGRNALYIKTMILNQHSSSVSISAHVELSHTGQVLQHRLGLSIICVGVNSLPGASTQAT